MTKYMFLSADNIGNGIHCTAFDSYEEALRAMEISFIKDLQDGLRIMGVEYDFPGIPKFRPIDVEAWCEAFLSQDSGIIHFHKSGDEILYQIQLMEL